ncbi:MAG: DNA lyase [Deltaproteobacteria bacterium]|nr:DNA lyase [Deltaproteobacteria bacterium]
MRLWTVHPEYLDPAGLAALWREALLAQKVLLGATRGYLHHPQLARFRAQPQPVAAICTYLQGIFEESIRRGYHFDSSKIGRPRIDYLLDETDGQVSYEWSHLKSKLKTRAPNRFAQMQPIKIPAVHPLFRMVPGSVREWERVR